MSIRPILAVFRGFQRPLPYARRIKPSYSLRSLWLMSFGSPKSKAKKTRNCIKSSPTLRSRPVGIRTPYLHAETRQPKNSIFSLYDLISMKNLISVVAGINMLLTWLLHSSVVAPSRALASCETTNWASLAEEATGISFHIKSCTIKINLQEHIQSGHPAF